MPAGSPKTGYLVDYDLRRTRWGFTVSGQFLRPVASPLRVLSRVFLCQLVKRSLPASSVFIILIAGAIRMSQLGAMTTPRLLWMCPEQFPSTYRAAGRWFLLGVLSQPSDLPKKSPHQELCLRRSGILTLISSGDSWPLYMQSLQGRATSWPHRGSERPPLLTDCSARTPTPQLLPA